ncbi:MAG: hypothetical protein AAF204_05445, partial [Pseudomonadota bacterium]
YAGKITRVIDDSFTQGEFEIIDHPANQIKTLPFGLVNLFAKYDIYSPAIGNILVFKGHGSAPSYTDYEYKRKNLAAHYAPFTHKWQNRFVAVMR